MEDKNNIKDINVKNWRKTLKLSDLRVGDIGKILGEDEEFLVTLREPEDRVSGWTRIDYLNGYAIHTFTWNCKNPEVIKTGTGRLETKIIKDD